jgi:hypothetical protein
MNRPEDDDDDGLLRYLNDTDLEGKLTDALIDTDLDTGINEFALWCASLSEDELDEIADGVDDVFQRAITGMNATTGFEEFLVGYLPATPGTFMAPLYNVALKVQ